MAADWMIELSRAIDPALLMEDAGIGKPDPLQEQALLSQAKRLLLLASRQSGKSTTTSLIALHAALYRSESLILLVAKAERQSGADVMELIVAAPDPARLDQIAGQLGPAAVERDAHGDYAPAPPAAGPCASPTGRATGWPTSSSGLHHRTGEMGQGPLQARRGLIRPPGPARPLRDVDRFIGGGRSAVTGRSPLSHVPRPPATEGIRPVIRLDGVVGVMGRSHPSPEAGGAS
jgi:hypothetical protein